MRSAARSLQPGESGLPRLSAGPVQGMGWAPVMGSQGNAYGPYQQTPTHLAAQTTNYNYLAAAGALQASKQPPEEYHTYSPWDQGLEA